MKDRNVEEKGKAERGRAEVWSGHLQLHHPVRVALTSCHHATDPLYGAFEQANTCVRDPKLRVNSMRRVNAIRVLIATLLTISESRDVKSSSYQLLKSPIFLEYFRCILLEISFVAQYSNKTDWCLHSVVRRISLLWSVFKLQMKMQSNTVAL